MAESENVGRITRNTLFNMLRSTIGMAVAFVTGIVIARGLGPANAGIYTLVIWVTIAVSIIVDDGLSNAVMKSVAQQDPKDRQAVSSIVAFGIRAQLVIAAIGALAVAAASGLLASAFDIPNGQQLFLLAAFLVLLYALIDHFTAPINGLERQGILVPLKTAWVLVWLFIAAVAVLVYDAGLEVLIGLQVVIWLGAAVLHFVVMSRVVSVRHATALPPSRKRQIARSATALTLYSTLGLVVFNRSEVFILGYFATPADVAYYSIAYAMSDALQVIAPMALAFAVMPSISRSFADGDFAYARRAYVSQVRFTVLATCPIAVTGAVLSYQAISVLYGSAFDAAAVPFAVLLFSAGASRLGSCARWVLISSDRERPVVWLTAGAAVFCLGLGLALIPVFGVAGAVGAEASTQLVLMFASIAMVTRTVGFRFPTAGVLRIVAANIPVLVSVLLVSQVVDNDVLALLIGMIVTLPAYALGLWAARALTPFEKQYLRALAPAIARS